MALKEYLNLYKNSKRGGYAAIVLLFSSMIIIIPLLAVTFEQLMKFKDLADMLLRQKHEKIAVSTEINKSMEFLLKSITSYSSILDNPSSSSKLLIHRDSGIIGENTLLSEIYHMNYVISDEIDLSDDKAISDVFYFPPSRKTIAGERHFLIKTTLNKNEAPSYCKEVAVEISVSGNINELWHREYIIY